MINIHTILDHQNLQTAKIIDPLFNLNKPAAFFLKYTVSISLVLFLEVQISSPRLYHIEKPVTEIWAKIGDELEILAHVWALAFLYQ